MIIIKLFHITIFLNQFLINLLGLESKDSVDVNFQENFHGTKKRDETEEEQEEI